MTCKQPNSHYYNGLNVIGKDDTNWHHVAITIYKTEPFASQLFIDGQIARVVERGDSSWDACADGDDFIKLNQGWFSGFAIARVQVFEGAPPVSFVSRLYYDDV